MTQLGPSAPNDDSLTSLRSGDPRAIEHYWRELTPAILVVARRYGLSQEDAHDVCVETFLRVFQRLEHETDPVRDIRAFTYTVARNVSINYIRRSMRGGKPRTVPLEEEIDSVESLLSLAGDPNDASDDRLLPPVVAEAIAALSESDRVLIERYLLGESMSETARSLAISHATARRKYRAS